MLVAERQVGAGDQRRAKSRRDRNKIARAVRVVWSSLPAWQVEHAPCSPASGWDELAIAKSLLFSRRRANALRPIGLVGTRR